MTASHGGERSAAADGLAPVIPLFGGSDPQVATRSVSRAEAAEPTEAEEWHPTWVAEHDSPDVDEAIAEATDLAEKALLKKLRARSLSVSEARAVLRERQLDTEAAERVLQSLEEYGYLDDAALADQLIHSAVDRKDQGRQAIAQTLAKRGIRRDVADAALATLPDDDAERALEFARGKARSLSSLERETALRRLTGQLARRGYRGSVAMAAAREALDEQDRGGAGVRFR
ncbi:UNVERIFIED_CONTAM: RecX family transcriptional regulator [Microbacterium sp. SLM126]